MAPWAALLRLGLVCLTAIVAGGWRGVGAQDGGVAGQVAPFEDPGQALVRVVHASPDAPALDLYAGDRVVASGLVAGDATGFLPVPDGELGLRFVPAGGELDSAIVETRFDLVDGGAYEVVALGQLREIDGRVYEIDRTRFETPGMARVRFLHLAPDAGEIDVFAGQGEVLFEGADFADATGYSDVAAGSYGLAFRVSDPAAAAADGTELATSELVLAAGEVYDILAVGLAGNETFGILPLVTASDLPCGDVLSVGEMGDACVRVVHASIDTPAFDVVVDGGEAPLVTGVEVGAGSGFVPILAGKHEIRLVAVGPEAGAVLRETTVDLDAGTAYDLAALDLRGQLDVRTIALDLSPLGAGQARLRIVHAMPNQSGLVLGLATGEGIFDEVRFPDASPALEIPAGTLDLEIASAADADAVLATENGFDLAAGTVYVVYVIGAGDGTVARVLTLTTPAQRMAGGTVGTGSKPPG